MIITRSKEVELIKMEMFKVKAKNIKKGEVIPIKSENGTLKLKIVHSKGVFGFVESLAFAYKKEEK